MTDFLETIRNELESIHAAGVYKDERILLSPQQARIRTKHGEVLNFCANNYLGLANHPEILEAARNALDQYGYGMSSVRFICGTQDVHKQLEESVAKFLGMEDAILYSSCFDANGGLFEALLTEQDAVISDRLNHASIIDGVRLCKASRFRYNHADMNHLETQLKRAQKNRFRMIATDGVFSMDGDVAPIKEICELAKRYQAIVMVDDSHATGFFGATGRGSIEYQDALGEVQIITSTFGKALGGASGGFTAASHKLVSLLRQRSRPYLFSNSLSPVIAATTLKAIELIAHSPDLIRKLQDNTLFFRKEIEEAGFDIRPGSHPIIPIMLGEEHLAKTMADKLLAEGVYVIGFSHPVVPRGQARIRVQISAVHEREDIDQAVAAFQKIGRELGVIT
ncbi:MAG TPA: glycine C-acetyltransferase [Nitrospina sp.]|jgi:glycine C-acetyltransferase|nr:glycine C-acetyltransferase [Nitrospinaceae bacterium]MDP7148524.1 glycine C-acetyltransferase [Nitrospinaceae bacterium]MDP7612211.1 glycine C-acetyltransferase [Nitrospinaceae bacterium]HAX45355.1 glycine C-acetyltransferase [Nitrospina sp.]|tara:strand:+ start:1717 stop:2901 length:1185 start_codon:yes stop_codon:yes gene_type:complete